MANIPLPTLRFGKTKARSVMNLGITDDGRLVDKEILVFDRCALDQMSETGFFIDRENQYLGPDNNPYQIIFEGDAVPLAPRVESPFEDKGFLKIAVNSVTNVNLDKAELEQFKKAKQSDSWGKFMWIVSIVFGSLVIIAAITKFGG